MKKYIIYIL